MWSPYKTNIWGLHQASSHNTYKTPPDSTSITLSHLIRSHSLGILPSLSEERVSFSSCSQITSAGPLWRPFFCPSVLSGNTMLPFLLLSFIAFRVLYCKLIQYFVLSDVFFALLFIPSISSVKKALEKTKFHSNRNDAVGSSFRCTGTC